MDFLHSIQGGIYIMTAAFLGTGLLIFRSYHEAHKYDSNHNKINNTKKPSDLEKDVDNIKPRI